MCAVQLQGQDKLQWPRASLDEELQEPDRQEPSLTACAQLRGQDKQQWPRDEDGQLLEPEKPGTMVELEGNLLILAVGNGRQAGGGVQLCPDAGQPRAALCGAACGMASKGWRSPPCCTMAALICA